MLTDKDFFKNGKKVRFSTFGMIGSSTIFEGVVLGTVSPSIVPAYANAEINHANIWPAVDQEVRDYYADRHNAYEYVVLQSTDSSVEPIYIGLGWINGSTVQEITERRAVVTISNFTDVNKQSLQQLLALNGYSVGSIEIIE